MGIRVGGMSLASRRVSAGKGTMKVLNGIVARCVALPLLLAPVGCNGSRSPQGNPASRTAVVSVAAASDLSFALDEVIAEFEKHHPQIQVKAAYGSSGNFFAQLSNKAPFDIFFSADMEYPRRLVALGHADVQSEFLYAVGHIVLWVRSESPLDVASIGINAVVDPGVRKLAIANPKHAPYGRAAAAALKHFGVYEQVQDRLVLGENIAQTAQFVESGAADAGVIALSLALSPRLRDRGRYWAIPPSAHPPLEQGGVILIGAKDRAATDALRAFTVGARGRAILKKHGFALPGG